jgi:putative transcriptional regulator
MNKFSKALVDSMREAYEHAQGPRIAPSGLSVTGHRVLLRAKRHTHGLNGRRFRGKPVAMQHPRVAHLRVHVVEVPNVRAIRRKLRMSQTEFAEKYRIPLPTLKNWEQGRRQPDATASAYLQAIAMRPREISEAFESSP